jgi:hypothetical protein
MAQELEVEDYEKLIPALESVADKTLTLEPEPDQISQTALF